MPRKKLPSGIYKRGEVYYCCFASNGTRVRKKLSTDLEVSEVMLRKLRLRHEANEVDNDYPLTKLIERYFQHQGPRLARSSLRRYRTSLQAITGHLRLRLASDVSTDTIVGYRLERQAEGAATSTVEDQEVGTLKRVLRWGARNKIINSNPLENLDRVTLDEVDVRPFSVEEAEAILDVLKPRWQTVFHVMFCTGLRRVELAGLYVEDIDLEARALSVPKRLAKKPASVRTVPILDCVYPAFQEACIGQEPGALAFPSSTGNNIYNTMFNIFDRAMERAEVERRHYDSEGRLIWKRAIHAIRHSYATWLRQAGAPREVVEDLIGHKRSGVIDRYLTFDLGAKRDAASKHPWGIASPPEGIVPFKTQPSHKAENADASRYAVNA